MEKLKFSPSLALLIVLQIMLLLVLVMQPIQATTAAGNYPQAGAGRGVPRDRFSWLSGRRFLEGEGGKVVVERVPYSTLPAPTANLGRRVDTGPPQQVMIPPPPPPPYGYRERPERPTCPRCQIP